jgi:hypothetical protein
MTESEEKVSTNNSFKWNPILVLHNTTNEVIPNIRQSVNSTIRRSLDGMRIKGDAYDLTKLSTKNAVSKIETKHNESPSPNHANEIKLESNPYKQSPDIKVPFVNNARRLFMTGSKQL